MQETTRADKLTRLLTAFPTFHALCTAKGGYFPSLRVDRPARKLLADLYDKRQRERRDRRRVHRWTVSQPPPLEVTP